MAGIFEPGLMVSGFSIQRRSSSLVLGAAPEAMVSRLMRWVRSGPKLPSAAVPWTVWQLMHAVRSKTARPRATASDTCAGCCWARTQRSKSWRLST